MILKNLPVKLSNTEVKARGVEMAQRVREFDEIDAARKAAAKDFRTKLENKSDEIRNLARIVTTGEEIRSVECRVDANLERGTMDTTRMDTFEIVESRPMTHTERLDNRQGKLLTLDVVPASEPPSNQ